jgi:GTPase SAR1 family protein
MTRCTSCGVDNDPGTVFCVACGHFLEWTDSEPVRTPPAQPVPAPAGTPERPTARPPPPPEPADPQPGDPQPVGPVEPVPSVALVQSSVPAAPIAPPAPEPDPISAAPAQPETSGHGIIDAIDAGRHLAAARGRTDLDAHLGQTRDRLAARTVTVVVVGEFKRGKSTLINALLQHAVCPVDADVVTAVPTTVCYADHPRVLSYVRTEDGGRTDVVEESLDHLTALVTEEADPADPDRLRTVEVGLPHRMLRSGLCLVDTPGVGGLDSAHGFLTLGALRMAQATLFVTDAAQELTGPELEFLKTAVERCPLTALVVTKTDLYPQWRRIVELDQGHLARAGLDLPVIGVSSFLRLRAAKDPVLNDESGYADLVAYLAGEVVAKTRAGAAQAAAREVEFVASQLEQQSQAERAVLAEPGRRQEVVAELGQVQRQTRKLLAPTATWQQTLADGIQDLVSDVEHDLQARLRTVIHDVEEIIDQGDPKDTWADTEVWLRRQVAIVTVANRDMLTARAEELAKTVAEQFDLEAGTGIALHLEAVGEALDAVTLASASSLTMPGGKLAPLMMAARTSFYVPMLLGSLAASAIPGLNFVAYLAIAGISLSLGGGIGRKIIADEKKRQRTYRQQQAKAAVRRFIEEVAFIMNKQTRDGLRSTQRQLRDDFQARAILMDRSAARALDAAQRTSGLDADRLRARERELKAEDRRLDEVRTAARELGGGGG